jgi:hypothetical protein
MFLNEAGISVREQEEKATRLWFKWFLPSSDSLESKAVAQVISSAS